MLQILTSAFLGLSLALVMTPAHASEKNALQAAKKFENCAEVETIAGATCQDLAVNLDVSRCGDPKRVVAAKVKCDGEQAVATYLSPKFEYRATFEAKRNWWGKAAWELKGEISRSRRKVIAAPAPVPAPAPFLPPPPPSPNAPLTEVMGPHSAMPPAVSVTDANSEDEKANDKVEEKVDRVLSYLTELTVKGSIDMYYTINFNKPPALQAVPTPSSNNAQNTYRVFDTYHDSLQLSYAHLLVQKPAEPVGVLFDLAYGPAMQSVSGPMTDASQMNVKQVVLSYKLSNGLLIEVGRFVTHIGYEVIESHDNWNYSRGLLFGYFDPFWHQGLKVTYPIHEKVSIMGLLVNGWNNSYEFNDSKNVGLQVAAILSDSVTVIGNFLTGVEPSAPGQTGGERKTIYDFIATYKASNLLSFAVNADYVTYGSSATPATPTSATGAAFYARYDFAENWSVTPRFEIVKDPDNLALGGGFSGGQTVNSYTITLENKLTENLAWRAEARRDISTQGAFMLSETPKATQETATLALIGSF